MTSGQARASRGANHGTHWLAALASLAVGAAFLALWFWLLPPWLGFQVDMASVARWRWIAAVPSALGFAVALRCVWDFGWTGRGTPAPFDTAGMFRGGSRDYRPGASDKILANQCVSFLRPCAFKTDARRFPASAPCRVVLNSRLDQPQTHR